MVLQYMLSDPVSANREPPKDEPAKRQTTKCETKAKQTDVSAPKRIITKRRVLICLLLLAYLIVAVAGYNLWTAEKGAPVWKSLTAGIFDNLQPAEAEEDAQMPLGTVAGIIYSEENPSVLINHELIREGDITHSVKVVKISKREVEFEKDGERWTQKVLAKPNPAWEATKSPTE
jgi:hypothetical protein